jgi:hypothetical protein
MRILGLGFLPPDDALRHAAKAVAGRPWSEILLLRPEVVVDPHPGWHAFLGLLHRAFGWGTVDLVFASVILLLALFLGVALAASRTHAWALALCVVLVCESNVLQRWLSGRPFLLHSSLLLFLCLAWSKGRLPEPRDARFLIPVFAVLLWIHPLYYLWSVPVAVLLVCRQIRPALVLAVSVGVGFVGSAILSGRPIGFIVQNTMHPIWLFGHPAGPLVSELQPSPGAPALFAVVVAALLGRLAERPHLRVWDPTFVMAFVGWTLGFYSARFWVDWGLPALLAWGIRGVEGASLPLDARRAGWAAIALTIACAAAFTSDDLGRWSRVDKTYAALTEPRSVGALPEPGGILYSEDMFAFFQIFFRRPDAPFRFAVGFERGLMRPEDAEVLRGAARRGNDRFAPWVARMTPRDRLIVRAVTPGNAYGLEWTHVSGDVWSGRLRPPAR